MKKTFIGLLVIAVAGAGLYYYLRKSNPIEQKLIVGQWKIDSLVPVHDSTKDALAILLFAMDSNSSKEIYDFRTDGKIYIHLTSDSLNRNDTNSYEWTGKQQLSIIDNGSGRGSDTMQVLNLNKTALVLQTRDSTKLYFSKK